MQDSNYDSLQDPEFNEAAPPKPWLAALLSLLAPGMGFAYSGQPNKALILNTSYCFAYLLIFILWLKLKFFPPLPFLFLALVFGISLIRHSFYAYQSAKHSNLGYSILRHPIFLFFSSSFTFWLPLIFTSVLAQQLVIQTIQASSDVMMPNIHRGDVVFVDRSAFSFTAPERGDLVLVEEHMKGSKARRAFFARVIAIPGDSIQLQGSLPLVNKKKLKRLYAKTRESLSDFAEYAIEIPYAESDPSDEINAEPAQWYSIIAPEQILYSKTETITLDSEAYFILEDNREIGFNRSQNLGLIVHRSWIKGRPLYIFYNALSSNPYENSGVKLR